MAHATDEPVNEPAAKRPAMAAARLSFFWVLDQILTRLPQLVRQRLVNDRALLLDLLTHGGRRGFAAYAQAIGYRGRWLRETPGAGPPARALARRLGKTLNRMKSHQRTVAAEYQPAPAWGELLDGEWTQPRRAVEQGDGAGFERFLDNFFRNGGIAGFWGAGRMYEDFAGLSGWPELQRLAGFLRQFEAWRREHPACSIEELAEPAVGNPWGYDIAGRLVVEPGFEYHSLASRVNQLLPGNARPVVVEIGGGYGGLARQLIKQIPGLRYVGLDLPENAVIQAWYLGRSLPACNVVCAVAWPGDDGASATLLPNWEIAALQGPVDVVLNTHSFGEMSRSTLAAYFVQIARLAPMWVYHDNLSAPRRDGFYGLTASEFPDLPGYQLVMSAESRWPRYRHESPYPCREYLFRRRSA